MKIFGIIIILLIEISEISFCQNQLSKDDCILLIKYNETKYCREIDENSDEIDSVKWVEFCNEFAAFMDDFSEYFYNTQKFYAQTRFDSITNSKIIFWNYGNIKTINKLPFKYSKIWINYLLNDSSIQVEYNKGKRIILNPKIVLNDSIIEKENIEKKTKFVKTEFTIENLGLIKKESIIDLTKVKFNDTMELLKNLGYNEVRSRYNGNFDSLSTYIFKNLQTQNIKGIMKIYIQLDYTGKVKVLEVKQGINSEIDAEVVRVLKNINWLPCKYHKDLSFVLPINFHE